MLIWNIFVYRPKVSFPSAHHIYISPSWLFLIFHPWFKAFRGAISVPLNVVPRQNKQTATTTTKNVGWDKCQRYQMMLLLACRRQETRCRDAIWGKFVSPSRHMRDIPNTQAPEFILVSSEGPLTVRDASVFFCTSACECGTSCSGLRNWGDARGRNLAQYK